MSISSFNELSDRIGDNIRSQHTNMRLAVGPKEMCAVTVRYLATGCSIKELHFSYRIGHSTLCQVIRKTCSAIWTVLRGDCFPPFTADMWKNISQTFLQQANFPNCLGAIDGKHIRIINPEASGSLYFNYKHYFSLVLLAVADARYKFLYLDVGSYGKDSDSTIFEKCSFNQMLQNNELNLPDGNTLPGTTYPVVPYVFVGDEAFSLSQHVLRPYSGKCLSYKKRIFNFRLSRARRHVECAFGILSNKWRIFHRPLNGSVDLNLMIIKACCSLHNFTLDRDGFELDDTLTIEGFQNNQEISEAVRGGRNLNELRNVWTDYFVSETGKLSWQDKCV